MHSGGDAELRIENGEWKMTLSLREFHPRCA